MSIPWYSFYVGDYTKKTAHLSLLEHGVYRLLIDHYMTTLHPLPKEPTILYRICRATSPTERKSVLKIVHEFFTLVGEFYHNDRCDAEVAKCLEYSGSQSAKAKLRHSRGKSGADAAAVPRARDTTTTVVVDKSTPTPQKPKTDPTEFEDFWNRWEPFEMTKGSKQDALKSYTKARKETDHATLVRTSAQYAANCRRLGCKTKHASTWLNGRGWESDDATGEVTNQWSNGHGQGARNSKPTAYELAMADRTHRGGTGIIESLIEGITNPNEP